MSDPQHFATAGVHHHAVHEDVIAIIAGSLLVSLGMSFLARGHLASGGTAGLALLLQPMLSLDLERLFFLINLPFYWLALRRMGIAFAVRTFFAISLTMVLIRLMGDWIMIDRLDICFAAVSGGTLIGVGLLMLFRHRTGLGGTNILALYIQERTGLRAGYFQLVIDLMILAAGSIVMPTNHLLLSVLGAVITNMILALNHRPGRYVGMSGLSA